MEQCLWFGVGFFAAGSGGGFEISVFFSVFFVHIYSIKSFLCFFFFFWTILFFVVELIDE